MHRTFGENLPVTDDIPRRSVQRTAKLASLPLGVAGRVAAGWGKRLTGRSSEEVNAELIAKTAEQLFAVLGQLKGGAMKFGQALSVFEAAAPPIIAEPFREALVKLQAEAPPMPTTSVHRMLAEQLGAGWRDRFAEFNDTHAAAASIGQVHRAVWHDGRPVAVKVQYPGADHALKADLKTLKRFTRLFQMIVPGAEIRPLLDELEDRMVEELDYRSEAEYQRTFAKAFADDPKYRIPKVVASAPKVIISEWLDGVRMSKISAEADQATRDRTAELLMEFQLSSPARCGLLHADPHPGNFMLLDDGRLGILDFGAAARLPDGNPKAAGRLVRLAADGRSEELMDFARAENFITSDNSGLTAQDVMTYMGPLTDPVKEARFHYTRKWLQFQAGRLTDFGRSEFDTGRGLNLPAQHMLLTRVWGGTAGILCQMEVDVPTRSLFEKWVPGFAE
ncbi:AarF/ABC1/UbiB kinase family protein [Pseudonocardiaceae bacterium YIM PH 21723]|nr:AarF/ABC1/UbiB kinase family protein [Pseudonocardiaceae bacterium YIM PH 21723]